MITHAHRQIGFDFDTAVSRFNTARRTWQLDVENRYKGADRNRFTRDMVGTNPQGTSADFHQRTTDRFYFLQEIARDIDRNDMVAGQAMDRLCVNVLQGGFTFVPQYDHDGLESYVKQRWADFSEDPLQVDFQRQRPFNQMTELILRQSLTDGDHIVLPLVDGSFQMIESHLLRTPIGQVANSDLRLCAHGVQLNQNRQRIRYYISEDDVAPNETGRFRNFRGVPAFDATGSPNVFHVANLRRTSQTRGTSVYAPIVQAVGLLDDIQFAKLVQQQQVSVWLWAIKRQLAGEYPEDEDLAQRTMDDLCSPGELKPLDDVSAGMIFRGLPGEELEGFSPNVPNPTYIDHAKQVMELIGTNLGLPYIVLMMDASQTNFSGWRGALDQAKMLWQRYQRNLACEWHREAFNFKMRQWTQEGTAHSDPFLIQALRNGVDLFSHSWGFPAWPYVNPIEDVTAHSLEQSKAINSPRRIQSRLGRDFDVVIVGELLDDNFKLIDRAMSLAGQLQDKHPGQTVSWERLISVSPPDNVNLNMSKQLGDEPAKNEPLVAG